MERDRVLFEVRDYLDSHLDDPPGIVQLARLFGINDFKLKRAFKEAFGTTTWLCPPAPHGARGRRPAPGPQRGGGGEPGRL